MLNSVRIGKKDVFTDFGCYLAHVEIGAPSVKTKYVSVPLRNGDIDLTQLLTNDIKYDDREVTIDLLYKGDNLVAVVSDLENYLQGYKYRINFDDDIGYFYVGRLRVENYTVKNYGGIIHIKAKCDPFKYMYNTTAEDWEWDPFDFVYGYINVLSNIVVEGTYDAVLIAGKAKMYSTVTTNAQINVTYRGVTVTLPVGTTTLYDFDLREGENTLTFTGYGIVTVDYRGGRL